MSMKTLEYIITFNTPAFLGNAEQQAQWRTPPFKALLRQWWRVALAAETNFKISVNNLRQQEGILFGNAALTHEINGKDVANHSKSKVRIRLSNATGNDAWSPGSQSGVAPLPTGLDTSYAWFGLVNRGRGLRDKSGIKSVGPESVRTLRLAIPEEQQEIFQQVMALINAFGLVGSRSRGGWGSLRVDGVHDLASDELLHYSRSLSDCLKGDWAMSLAKDDVGLCVWESKIEFTTWDQAMRFIAIQRKKVRTALKTDTDLRPALGFATPGRMPSPLRWKVKKNQADKLAVRVFALPHDIPEDAKKSLSPERLVAAWSIVTKVLDSPELSLERLEKRITR